MPRPLRIDVKGYMYHVINRANARIPIFDKKSAYQLFEGVLLEARERHDMRILAYCIMPNHWHLLLYPKSDGDLSKFMCWLTMTHTQRWHAQHKTIGSGHLYQGRYKSCIVEKESYFYTLMRYIEQNALRAKLVRRSENWKWGSLYHRVKGTSFGKKLLSPWLVEEPLDYLEYVNELMEEDELEPMRGSVNRGRPYGSTDWQEVMIKKYDLESTVRYRGRPKKGS